MPSPCFLFSAFSWPGPHPSPAPQRGLSLAKRSCPCRWLLASCVPRPPHLLHPGSPLCPVCAPHPTLLCHLSSQNATFTLWSWVAMGKPDSLPSLTLLPSLWGTDQDPSYSCLLGGSRLHWPPAFTQQVSTHDERRQQLIPLTHSCVWAPC